MNYTHILKLRLDAGAYFSLWMESKQNHVVVMGSFGRSGLSELFNKSLAANVIADHKLPVFIAHK